MASVDEPPICRGSCSVASAICFRRSSLLWNSVESRKEPLFAGGGGGGRPLLPPATRPLEPEAWREASSLIKALCCPEEKMGAGGACFEGGTGGGGGGGMEGSVGGGSAGAGFRCCSRFRCRLASVAGAGNLPSAQLQLQLLLPPPAFDPVDARSRSALRCAIPGPGGGAEAALLPLAARWRLHAWPALLALPRIVTMSSSTLEIAESGVLPGSATSSSRSSSRQWMSIVR